jgi:hypothetical protein
MSFIKVGWDQLREFVRNRMHATKSDASLPTDAHLPPPPPPPLPPLLTPLEKATSAHVDYIVDMACPTIIKLADGNLTLGALSSSAKEHLNKLGLTQLRNGKILPATAEESQVELLDNTAMSLLHADKELILVPRDGNCMFNALAICYGGLISSAMIRNAAVTYVVANWDDKDFPFRTFVQNTHPGETTDSYKRRLLPPSKAWGDYPELVAAANVYRHHLYILDLPPNATKLTPHLIEAEGLLANATTYFVVRVGDNHYHAGAVVSACLKQY